MQTSSPAPDRAERDERPALAELLNDPTSRKKFLRMVGGAGAAGAFATLVAACGERETPIGITQSDPGTVSQFGPGDSGIVNYALFLEYVEGEFYDRIVEGNVVKDRRLREVFKRVRSNEEEHLRALQQVAEQIGRPISKPKTNFDKVFARGQDGILEFSATLENLGSSAYLGQAPRISDRMILASALSIHTVEARHAAMLNDLAGRGFVGNSSLKGSIPDGAFAKPRSMEEVLREAAPFIVGGVPGGIPPLEEPGA